MLAEIGIEAVEINMAEYAKEITECVNHVISVMEAKPIQAVLTVAEFLASQCILQMKNQIPDLNSAERDALFEMGIESFITNLRFHLANRSEWYTTDSP